MLDLSVIIVTYNSEDSIDKCLSSIGPSAGNLKFEIIVVDNGSKDRTFTIAQKYEFAKLVETGKNLGFAAACNIGARMATGKFLLFINPDAYVLDDAIVKLVHFESTFGDEAVVGGAVIDHDGKVTPNLRSFPSVINQLSESLFLYKLFPKSGKLGTYYYTNRKREFPMRVDAVEGSFVIIPRGVFERLSGFDEHFFLYSEDTDLCFRAGAMGIPVMFFPGSVAVHTGPQADTRVSRRYILAMHLAQLKFIRRHFFFPKRLALEILKIFGLLIRVPLYGFMSLLTLRLDLALKSLYTLEAATRGVFSSDPPPSLFE